MADRYVKTLAADRRACVADYLRHVGFLELWRDWRRIRSMPRSAFRLVQALDDPFGPAFALTPSRPIGDEKP